jgi:nucleoid-associated protein YgaU
MQTKTLAIGGAAVIAVTVAGAIILRPIQDDMRARQNGGDALQEQTIDAADPVAVAVVTPEVGDAVLPQPDQPAPVILPEMTQRRFEPDGAFLVSGTAAPQQPLSVMIDGLEVKRVDVGADGTFLVIGFLGFSDSPRIMTLVGDPDGAALVAERTFIFDANPAPVVAQDPVAIDTTTVDSAVDGEPPTIEITENDQDTPEPAPVVAKDSVVTEATTVESAVDGEPLTIEITENDQDTPEPAPTQDTAAPAAAVDTVGVAQAVDTAIPDAAPATPAILAISGDGVEIVQPAMPADTPPEVMSNVALDTITYDPQGEVVLQGRALGQGFVQVYVDNMPVSRLPVDAQGRWRGDLPDVDTGVYTLRIDEIDSSGDVVSRIETPFLREDPAAIVETMAAEVGSPEFSIATRTIQPGNTLWAIAEERYGSGVLYVNVFEANKDRIRDPDLIYPGQVFLMPEVGLAEDDS